MDYNNPTTPVAVVTGSSRGIGAAIAERLAAEGHNVVLNATSDNGMNRSESLAKTLADRHGVQCVAYKADVSSPEQADALIGCALDAFGRVDVLVCNAGITRDKLLARMSAEDFATVVDVNLGGTFNCLKAATKPLMKQRYGRVICLSSVVGVYGNAGQANYAASKAGIIGLVKSAAKELAPRGITVNAVAPGFIETDMTDAMTDAAKEAAASRIAARRLGDPAEVAAAVAFLAHPEAGYITGQVLEIDGGISL